MIQDTSLEAGTHRQTKRSETLSKWTIWRTYPTTEPTNSSLRTKNSVQLITWWMFLQILSNRWEFNCCSNCHTAHTSLCISTDIQATDRSWIAAQTVMHLKCVHFKIRHLHSYTRLMRFCLLLKNTVHGSWSNSCVHTTAYALIACWASSTAACQTKMICLWSVNPNPCQRPDWGLCAIHHIKVVQIYWQDMLWRCKVILDNSLVRQAMLWKC
jgi:hypothetical protein